MSVLTQKNVNRTRSFFLENTVNKNPTTRHCVGDNPFSICLIRLKQSYAQINSRFVLVFFHCYVLSAFVQVLLPCQFVLHLQSERAHTCIKQLSFHSSLSVLHIRFSISSLCSIAKRIVNIKKQQAASDPKSISPWTPAQSLQKAVLTK